MAWGNLGKVVSATVARGVGDVIHIERDGILHGPMPCVLTEFYISVDDLTKAKIVSTAPHVMISNADLYIVDDGGEQLSRLIIREDTMIINDANNDVFKVVERWDNGDDQVCKLMRMKGNV